jgi:transposase-like protein
MRNENEDNKFPATLQEAIIYFANADNALGFMATLRWPDGKPTCPWCESKKSSFISTRRIWKCRACKKNYTVKLGTVMEDSPITLDKWLTAIWMIAGAKNGISSYEIHRALGLTQKSSWFLLHRIRLAMQKQSFDKLSGEIEADETFIGGKARNMHKAKRAEKIKGRGPVGKTIVMGMLERRGEVRVSVVESREAEVLQAEIRENVEPGSEVFTDEHVAYEGLSQDFIHQAINHAVRYVEGRVHTNGIENFWALLKRCLKGTYISVMPFHLFRYLDEEAFRYNTRKGTDQIRFLLTCESIIGRRLTYKKLIGQTLLAE